jgi:superfamily I DNA/RNA helicase
MTPVDLEQRERAIRQLATSLALSAGAGSGKTTVLASRIAEHLATGTAPSRLAAITFTREGGGRARVPACATPSRSVSRAPRVRRCA